MAILAARIFDQFTWIEHGFGTRASTVGVDGMASLKQVHSAVVLVASHPGCAGDGDALITDIPGLPVSVRTADCFPILLADSERHVVAAVHAGWRGTAARILPRTIEMMRTAFESNAKDIHAAIGPGIGECCYEVGEDVARHFGLDRAGRLNLGQANRDQLIESGVPETQIESLGRCTFCEAASFHSYRRDKHDAGRMISYIGIHTSNR